MAKLYRGKEKQEKNRPQEKTGKGQILCSATSHIMDSQMALACRFGPGYFGGMPDRALRLFCPTHDTIHAGRSISAGGCKKELGGPQ